MSDEMAFEQDRRRLRGEGLIRQVLDTLRQTVQARPDEPAAWLQAGAAIHVEFTDESARVIAPLVEAVQILEDIIFASDGCIGHRDCQHSMEPWQRARALLRGKWEADEDRRRWPDPAAPFRCPHCGRVSFNPHDAAERYCGACHQFL